MTLIDTPTRFTPSDGEGSVQVRLDPQDRIGRTTRTSLDDAFYNRDL